MSRPPDPSFVRIPVRPLAPSLLQQTLNALLAQYDQLTAVPEEGETPRELRYPVYLLSGDHWETELEGLGLEATDLACVLLLSPGHAEDVRRGIACGIHAFAAWDDSIVGLRKAILSAATGSTYCSPSIQPLLLSLLQEAYSAGGALPASPGAEQVLTQREREIGELALRGLSNREIGGTLHISDDTIKSHLRRLFRKLGIHRRMDLRRFANLLSPPSPGEPSTAGRVPVANGYRRDTLPDRGSNSPIIHTERHP